jgi:ferric-dicitrate binding protein FerR (iron transport regulator)
MPISRTAKRERLLRVAAMWFERIHDRGVSDRQMRAWERWMTRSRANRQAYLAVEHVCRVVERLRGPRRQKAH